MVENLIVPTNTARGFTNVDKPRLVKYLGGWRITQEDYMGARVYYGFSPREVYDLYIQRTTWRDE